MGMYNLKNVMLGFGLGLVLSSLININVQSKDVTIDFIKSEALKKGLIIVDPKDVINKSISLTDAKSDDYENREIVIVEVRIEKGFDSYKTADVLFNEGLIEDKKTFIDLLYECKKTNSIQCGVFFIQKGTGVEEIINIITNSSNNNIE